MSLALQLVNVEVSRGRARILGPLSLEVQGGEFWGVVGPNGAGKSTLLRVMAGITKPTSGQLRAPGEIGLLFQHHDFLPDLPFSVRDVVEFGRAARTGPGRRLRETDRRAIAEALRTMQLEDCASRLYRELSGGERQKTQLARLLAQQAEVLLLDEPTAGLDLDAQERLVREIERIHRETRRTFVVVTHEVQHLPACTSKVLLLKEGRPLAAGPPGDVLSASLLSGLYDCPMRVECESGRYRAWSAGDAA